MRLETPAKAHAWNLFSANGDDKDSKSDCRCRPNASIAFSFLEVPRTDEGADYDADFANGSNVAHRGNGKRSENQNVGKRRKPGDRRRVEPVFAPLLHHLGPATRRKRSQEGNTRHGCAGIMEERCDRERSDAAPVPNRVHSDEDPGSNAIANRDTLVECILFLKLRTAGQKEDAGHDDQAPANGRQRRQLPEEQEGSDSRKERSGATGQRIDERKIRRFIAVL